MNHGATMLTVTPPVLPRTGAPEVRIRRSEAVVVPLPKLAAVLEVMARVAMLEAVVGVRVGRVPKELNSVVVLPPVRVMARVEP